MSIRFFAAWPVSAKLRMGLALHAFAFFANAQVNVPTANYGPERANLNAAETILTPANVSGPSFGRLNTFMVDGQVYTQPLYVSSVSLPSGTSKNLVFVATMHNSVYAFDADALAGQGPVWQTNLGASVPQSFFGFRDIQNEIGILGTPVIDVASGTLYAVTDTFEDNLPVFRLHALSIVDGHEVQNPVVITADAEGEGSNSVDGIIAFDPAQHLQRPALALSNGTVVIAFGSHADAPPYHGWLLGYDAKNISFQKFVVNTTPNGDSGAIWQAGRAPALDSDGNIYVVTGNGDYDDSLSNMGESFLKYSPDGTLLDWFTPSDWETLSNGDYDMGSTGALFIPGTDVLLGGDKYGTLYATHKGAMGHLGAPVNSASLQVLQAVQYGGIFNLAVLPTANGAQVYLVEQGMSLMSYTYSDGQMSTAPSAQGSASFDIPYDGIAVSAQGTDVSSAIVWVTSGDHSVKPATGTLHAFNAQTLQEIWNSDNSGGSDALGLFAKFVSPTVANGKVFVPTFSNEVAVYGIFSGVRTARPQVAGVVNAASFTNGTFSPGEVVSIFGSQLGPVSLTNGDSSGGFAPTEAAGTQVMFDGVPAPLLYTSATQVGTIVPFTAASGTVQMQVLYNNQLSTSVALPISEASPGIFTSSSSGTGQAACLNQDGSVNSPQTPAAAGTIVSLYATGGGAANPALTDGQVADGVAPLSADVSVLIGGQQATVQYAGAAPGLLAGIVQVNVTIPPTTATSAGVPIVLQIAGQNSQSGVTIAVQ